MDQPQPVSQVLSVPVHIIVVQILRASQCHVLSCPHDLESGVLSDTSMDHPCGEGGRMLQSQWTGLVLAPPRGPCPAGLTCLQETEDHTAQEAGAHGGGRASGGPFGLGVDERERGSPGSPSEMSLSVPGPRASLSLRGHAPAPRGSNQKQTRENCSQQQDPSRSIGISLTSCNL